ncbi:hypothetical protein E3P99_01971 [Wallemia hederae]|uniref:Phosphoglycerate dehydrogenase n=1 Tax=Wallemia hederae TaxID=1540922 RepID=A0A4T0FMV2_9BASI|nr:hypothetical protein E3P99_01971 [Wallemia hederae]
MSNFIPIPTPRSGSPHDAVRASRVDAASSASPKALVNRNILAAALEQYKPSTNQPFRTEQLRILLLENVSQGAATQLREAGFHVDHFAKAWSEEELLQGIGQYHAIGIRSKTKLTSKVIKAASKLLVVGCFCIGTNQVDLGAAAESGICVFNSPYANSRSVAELVISQVIALSRQYVDRSNELKQGTWNKVSSGCWEVRGKTLGIVGYGHIGSQLSVLAEAMGMSVLYYDVLPIMPLGQARQVESLEQLLSSSDFVTLHVPELPETKNMIGAKELACMRKGAYLLNNARGTVVQLEALADALNSKHLAGAAVDVYPSEPKGNGANLFTGAELGPFADKLRQCPNLILTPHIGGSTEEAQRMIGIEVGTALFKYLSYGTSINAVQFPEVDLRIPAKPKEGENRQARILHVHKDEPGVLKEINTILSDENTGHFNVSKQYSDSRDGIAYLMADVTDVSEHDIGSIFDRISSTKHNILTRILH